jgi:hypothetical protein
MAWITKRWERTAPWRNTSIRISKKGDVAAAAEMARVLERLWDKAEDYGGDSALSKTNRQLFDEIDKAMDQFLTPIWDAKAKPPDPAKVKAAYNTYLEKLKLAD